MTEKHDFNKSQADKFKEAARALGCDENEGTVESAVSKVARHKLPALTEPKSKTEKPAD